MPEYVIERDMPGVGSLGQSELKGASRGMYESMSEKQLEEFAETKRKGLPEKKKTKH